MNAKRYFYGILLLSLQTMPLFAQDGILESRQSGASEGDPPGRARPNTGLSNPSVNPGQATGMRVLRGEVKQATIKTIVVEDRNGKETTMTVDAGTAGDRDVRPGDIITGTITAQGRAVAIHKEATSERDRPSEGDAGHVTPH